MLRRVEEQWTNLRKGRGSVPIENRIPRSATWRDKAVVLGAEKATGLNGKGSAERTGTDKQLGAEGSEGAVLSGDLDSADGVRDFQTETSSADRNLPTEELGAGT